MALVDIRSAFEDGFSLKHLTEDAAGRMSVITRSEEVEDLAHPTPHKSIAGVYRFSVRSNSGGRYQRVTTKLV